ADYVVINSMGNVDSRRAGLSQWDGTIRSMQGFFVKAKSTGDRQLDFTDDMKVTSGNSDGGFYRSQDETTSFKLTLENEQGAYSETLLGMHQDASNTKDQFDARLFATTSAKIYSLLDDEPYAIQGISPAFEQVEVPIGLFVEQRSVYTIALDEKVNLDGLQVILHDHLLAESKVLTASENYRFTAGSGEVNDRFTVTIAGQVTSTTAPESLSQMLYVDQHERIVITMNNSEQIQSLELISLGGQKTALTTRQIHEGTWQTTRALGQRGVFIARLLTDKGLYTQKIILK
ncbi:MAG: hypothetical protein AAFO69_08120, partial [Bacteroidota bacterium]